MKNHAEEQPGGKWLQSMCSNWLKPFLADTTWFGLVLRAATSSFKADLGKARSVNLHYKQLTTQGIKHKCVHALLPIAEDLLSC